VARRRGRHANPDKVLGEAPRDVGTFVRFERFSLFHSKAPRTSLAANSTVRSSGLTPAFVRSGTTKRRAIRQSTNREHAHKVQKVVALNAPRACQKCQKRWRKKGRLRSRTVQDLIFGKDSIKRRIIRYVAQTYCCRSCRYEYGVNELRSAWSKLGLEHSCLFHLPRCGAAHSAAHSAAQHEQTIRLPFGTKFIEPVQSQGFRNLLGNTKAKILDRIISGSLIHANETRANIKGQSAYVWVLTSLTEVVYILTESREGEIVQQLLKSFKGVLVSDFYAAYESIECPQQKCLIHLMRDLNDEMLNNPFDQEAKLIGVRFAALLRPIVETIDRRGLKAHFLRKHLREVERFYGFLDGSELNSDVASKLKQRFNKNRDKLFTFLRYDGVPWNNNNAEHAVKAFAGLRDVIAGSSTKKGIDEYVTLLSISETCKYRGIDFLDFLRSGERDVATFALNHRGSKC
jgi:hypothetical protein